MSKQYIGVSKGFQTLWWILKAKPLVGLGTFLVARKRDQRKQRALACMSVRSKAKHWRYVRGSARRPLVFDDYIYENEYQQFLLQPLLKKQS